MTLRERLGAYLDRGSFHARKSGHTIIQELHTMINDHDKQHPGEQLFIPTLGTEIMLVRDWTFKAVADYRNKALFKWLGHPELAQTRWPRVPNNAPMTATLPSGTKLKIDRIYIRKGSKDFDSVTFFAPGLPHQEGPFKRPFRFFAKLSDVNQMEVTYVPR